MVGLQVGERFEDLPAPFDLPALGNRTGTGTCTGTVPGTGTLPSNELRCLLDAATKDMDCERDQIDLRSFFGPSLT